MFYPLLSRRAIALAVACTTLPSIPQFASAQDRVLEEVIVTARRRQESLQETPVAVTALNATALRDAGVRNLRDLNEIAPNLDVHAANGTAPLYPAWVEL